MIIGERIRLRAVERADLPQFVDWLNDPEVGTGLERYLPFSQVEEEQWYERMLETPAAEHVMVIEAERNDSWKFIGSCGFHNFDWRSHLAEVGIVIGEKSYWNQGYGTETVRLMLQHGFNTLNLHRIYLRVFSTNKRAIRCYEKAGFVHEGRLRQAFYQDGEYSDVLIMSVLRSEWLSQLVS